MLKILREWLPIVGPLFILFLLLASGTAYGVVKFIAFWKLAGI